MITWQQFIEQAFSQKKNIEQAHNNHMEGVDSGVCKNQCVEAARKLRWHVMVPIPTNNQETAPITLFNLSFNANETRD
jgi:hypothetical protein